MRALFVWTYCMAAPAALGGDEGDLGLLESPLTRARRAISAVECLHLDPEGVCPAV